MTPHEGRAVDASGQSGAVAACGTRQIVAAQIAQAREQGRVARRGGDRMPPDAPTGHQCGQAPRMLRASRPPAPWPRRRRCTARPRPCFRPRLRSAPSSVTTMRAPLAPIGWPSAQAPPWMLTISCASLNSVIAAIVTAAKASLTSHRSTSLGGPAGLLQHLLDRADRRGREPVRRLRVHAVADDARDRLGAHLRGRALAHQHQRGGAVGDARRVGGGDRAVLLERGLQAGDLVELGLEGLLVELDHRVAGLAGQRHRRDLPVRNCRPRWPACCAASRRSRNASCASRVKPYLATHSSANTPIARPRS